MTPTSADTTLSPDQDWRRRSDPPGMWVAVVLGSVALHLLAFWLLRSYQFSSLWQQQSESTIAVELIDIDAQPQPKPTTKSVSPKPATTTEKLPQQGVTTEKLTVKPAPISEDERAIALAVKRQRELAAQQERELAALQRELAVQQQKDLVAQQQRELAAQQQRELAAQKQRELAAQKQRELAAQQQRENTNNTTENQEPLAPPADAAGGTLVATLVGEPQQGERDRHTNPAKIKPNNQPFPKGLEYVKFIEKKPGEPVEITAILTISEQGKLEGVAIADQSIRPDEKSEYEEFITNEVLRGWEFEPAYDNDPQDPKPSNLTVRILIQPLP
ncbi:hypothetical protein [Fortiea contorta]|uniref:hypothetical protein n=1 Tax=Fortiea contorta TaxID=1892405 RepID=UPI00035CA45F|nr:hypothetical protein [Fortiea contorta]